jgi:lipopolysaccharide/colanic/teichoic acid biosynthesis glycosyltransferase
MKIDAEASGPKLSSDNDNRITPIGKIIRKYRIDEFPQFINVLKGDMSIVGPRPEREFFINEILKVNPKYKRLHNVKPGITSLGQVYYGYAENISEMDKRLQYDLLYLKNFSFITDIKIILLTISIVFKGKGK